eukprot:gene17100-25960_t
MFIIYAAAALLPPAATSPACNGSTFPHVIEGIGCAGLSNTAATTATECLTASPPAPIPLPTAAQLKYQQQELVGITHFNMATFYHDGDPACDKTNWGTSGQPSSFAPTNTNVSNWIESYNAVGVQSVILTAKHGCGFLLWPTNVTLPDGSNYGYHVGGKGAIGIDIVSDFVHAMEAAGLAHSLYYSLKDSFYLNALGDNVRGGDVLPGQINVTQEQFENISLAAVTELWSGKF